MLEREHVRLNLANVLPQLLVCSFRSYVQSFAFPAEDWQRSILAGVLAIPGMYICLSEWSTHVQA